MTLTDGLSLHFLSALGVVAHPNRPKYSLSVSAAVRPHANSSTITPLTAVDAVRSIEVVKIARTYFALPDDPRFKVSIADGRLFVEESGPAIAAGRTRALTI